MGIPDPRQHVVKRIDLIGSTGLNQAHEQVPDIRPALGPIKQAVLAMKDRHLQNPLGDMVVERRARHAQELRQLSPAILHLRNGLPQA